MDDKAGAPWLWHVVFVKHAFFGNQERPIYIDSDSHINDPCPLTRPQLGTPTRADGQETAKRCRLCLKSPGLSCLSTPKQPCERCEAAWGPTRARRRVHSSSSIDSYFPRRGTVVCVHSVLAGTRRGRKYIHASARLVDHLGGSSANRLASSTRGDLFQSAPCCNVSAVHLNTRPCAAILAV